jgi:hypothetical protein
MAWRHCYQRPPGLLPGHIGPATFDADGVATSGLASVTASGCCIDDDALGSPVTGDGHGQ